MTLEGPFKFTDAQTVRNVTAGDITYISCDASAYDGDVTGAARTLGRAVDSAALAAVLYSNTSDFCTYTAGPLVRGGFNRAFSMTNSSAATSILAQLQGPTTGPGGQLRAQIGQRSSSGSGNTTSNQQQTGNPLGPSPSTAVAMIILYSITGVITALFLLIIVTGAVRAHRHPERYGPRDVLGRPRQSRAKGLARAMLDTIPIVKFGERLPPKTPDVELAESARANSDPPPTTATAATTEQNAASDNTVAAAVPRTEDDTNEITPAAVPAPTQPKNIIPDDYNTCSICTDDFELGQDIRVLPCNHTFHPACVDPWLLNVSGTCPLCRINLHPTASNSSNQPADGTDASNPDTTTELPPPIGNQPRRTSTIRELLNLRNTPANAPPEELVAALNRLREAQRAHGPAQDEAARRRMRRLSSNVRETFGIRTRRNGSVAATVAESQAGEDLGRGASVAASAGASAGTTEGAGQEQQQQQGDERRAMIT
ncbi:hypothetical protein H2201_005005 [Coniosporium apollinis]|uniref:RING-type domain-containing protein n=1 Tax=Coniosporium apollinis TaxID=61459 RepID=A0ABQ9NTC4_9PEZI|nr:hypothetical protein H2201_005005 [Coniosporium apollinis]